MKKNALFTVILLVSTALIFGSELPQYAVVFENELDINVFLVDSGQIVNEPAALYKNGYHFEGWYDENNELWDFENHTVDEDSVRIFAKWISNKEYLAIKDSTLQAQIGAVVKNDIMQHSNRITLLFLLLAVAVLVILIAGLIYILSVVNNKDRLRDRVLFILTGNKGGGIKSRETVFKENIVKEAVEEIQSLRSASSSRSSYDSKKIAQDIDNLRKRIEELEHHEAPDSNIKPITPGVESLQSRHTPTRKYADSIVNGFFNHVTEHPDDDTVFVLQLDNTDVLHANFEIYENAKRRVLKNADFIDGCEKQRINPNPVDILVESGNASLQENGKWQITQKAKVRFI